MRVLLKREPSLSELPFEIAKGLTSQIFSDESSPNDKRYDPDGDRRSVVMVSVCEESV